MVDVGEESGSLPAILEKASQIYERDIMLVLDTIIPLIEPVMMIVGIDGRQFVGGYVFTGFSADIYTNTANVTSIDKELAV